MASQGTMPPSASSESPPYAPMVWTLGGPPVKRVDIPAQTVFMVLFLIGAAMHVRIFRGNLSRGHKFVPNLCIFVFCMSRVLTSILRIAFVSQPRNARIALAAQIFLATDVLILFIINLIFAMRLVRATHRRFGWHLAFGMGFKILLLIIGATLIMIITATIQIAYTLDPQIRIADRSLQLYGSTVLAILATLPLPMVAITLLIPYAPIDEFGTGRLRTKVTMLLVSTTLLSTGAWYRCGITWQTPVPQTQPLPGYLGKGPFYVLNSLVELQTVMMYAILRVDNRWHIPNGAKGPGSYSKPQRSSDLEKQDSRPNSAEESVPKESESVHDDNYMETEIRIEINRGRAPPMPPIPENAHLSRSRSSHLSIPSSSRPVSRQPSLSQQILTKQPSSSQKREWRASEEHRIIRRLGGPWAQLPSPAESTFNESHTQASSPTRSMFSENARTSLGTGFSFVQPPSIRDTLHEGSGWTPEIQWDLASPRRFLSLKKKSLSLLG
ncbi:hypothetical protein BDU57DRAFT_536518 [Ampelomyces quisqualis]|uniref:Uncharacterized protein n=1 Tax=Ampelomyces quisqualis TaxID=50730 RepID=A0A6A5R0B1_AMPQU|nr:hypothetical protein BDU57DRAFT_536518 [Ampelomyces quisqualis]